MRVAVAAVLFVSLPLFAETFTVQSGDDSGFGTLRWAIEQANATPGRDTIKFADRTAIVLQKALPFVTEEVDIEGGFDVTIHAEAALDGLTITTRNAGVRYLAIAGARRAAFRVLGDGNTITDSTATGSAIGFQVLGDDNTIGAPPYECYFDPCPIFPRGNTASGNGVGIYVEGNDNEILGNIVAHSEEHGIIVTGHGNDAVENASSYNAWSAIAVAAENAVGLQTGVCNGHKLVEAAGADAVPHLTSVTADNSLLTIEGTLHAQPLQLYHIQLAANRGACETGDAESITPRSGWSNPDPLEVTTDANGNATFRRARYAAHAEDVTAWSVRMNDPADAVQTSDSSVPARVEVNAHPSADLAVAVTATRPAPAEITFHIAVTNHGPSAIETLVDVPRPAGAEYVAARILGSEHPTTCWLGGLQFCAVTLLAGETQTIEHTIRMTGSERTITQQASIRPGYDVPDPDPSNNAASASVTMREKPRAVRK